jgi:DNA modification methylase
MKGLHHTSVWKVDKPRKCVEHPTMKPVELYENAYLNNSDEGDFVYDPFAGSGTAVIAAEKTGRICRAIELEPIYCDVIRDRYYKWCIDNNRKPDIKLNGKPYKSTKNRRK